VWVRQEDASPERLAGEIDRLLYDEAFRAKMAAAAQAQGRPDAARDVAIDLLGLAGGTLRVAPMAQGKDGEMLLANASAARRVG
jgi:hypothetical protein